MALRGSPVGSALMRKMELPTGSKPEASRAVIPSSVSLPMIFSMAMNVSSCGDTPLLGNHPDRFHLCACCRTGTGRDPASAWTADHGCRRINMAGGSSEVMTRADGLDLARLLAFPVEDRPDMHDPVAPAAGDLDPVVGVGRVGEVLVLPELGLHRLHEVGGREALRPGGDQALDGGLLGPGADALDEGARDEVLEVEGLLLPGGVGDLEEAVALVGGEHLGGGGLDGGRGGLAGPPGELGGAVLPEDLPGGLPGGALDPDLHVEAAGAEDGGVDQVLPVARPDDDDVLEPLHPVELGEELGDDGALHVRGDAAPPGAEEGVHLVEEDDHGGPGRGLLLGPGEDLPELPLRLPDVLVQELG